MGNSLTLQPANHEAAVPDGVTVALLSARLGERHADGCWAAAHRCVRARAPVLSLLVAELLNACDGGSGGGAGQSPVTTSGGPTEPPMQVWTGHYVGVIKIADATYFGDAVFTRDGAVRLYIGGPDGGSGALQMTRPERSEQFLGRVQMLDGQWSGSGIIVGQECAVNAANRFCGQPASAEISATVRFDAAGSGTADLQGEIQVATTSGKETWLLDLLLWSDFTLATSAGSGQFKELLAEFASADDVIISFDSSGKFFFQSANSGCVGNGMLVPRVDGSADMYDASEAYFRRGNPWKPNGSIAALSDSVLNLDLSPS